MKDIEISKYDSNTERILGKAGVSTNNLKARTTALARLMGVTSISLREKEYSPQARFFNKLPKDKIVEAHNQLYKRFCEAL